MYPNTARPHDCYRPGDCDGSCTLAGRDLSEPISDAGHTVADGLRHDIERIQYEVRRLREAHANQPDWEKLWAKVSEENDRLRTLLEGAMRFYPKHDADPKVNLIGKEIREIVG